jgi:glycerol-3-phosphate cytidylyltransferase-like family protein
MTRIYMDGVFDLFHYGHVRAIQQCKCIADAISEEKRGNGIQDIPEIIIGIISDSDTESYKRLPIFTIDERTEMINAIGIVDEVISPAPLIVKEGFIKKNRIDAVVHGFSDDEDFEKQKGQHKELIDMGIFQRIQYTDTISTTDIINRIVIQTGNV